MSKAVSVTKYKVIAGVLGGVGGLGIAGGATATVLVVKKGQSPTTEKTYTIKFNSNKGSTVGDQIVVENKVAIEPKSPERTGYDFICWCKDEGLDQPFDWSKPITSDLTLYAKYKLSEAPVQVNVTFDLSGGTLESGSLTRKVIAGTKFGNINVPIFSAPTGMVFDHWNITRDTTIDTDTTIIANYVSDGGQLQHHLNFCVDGDEEWKAAKDTEKLEFNIKDSVTWKDVKDQTDIFPTITKTGYQIDFYYIPGLTGDYKDSVPLLDTTKITKDEKSFVFNVNIYWTSKDENLQSLVFTDLEGKNITWTGAQSFDGNIYSEWSTIISDIKAEQEGTSFVNWKIENTNLTSDYMHKTLHDILLEIYQGNTPSVVIVQPVFDKDAVYHKVTFRNSSSDKGTMSGTTTRTVLESTKFVDVVKPTILVNDGYVFLGWWNSATQSYMQNSDKITSALSLEAKYTASIEYCTKLSAYENDVTLTLIQEGLHLKYSSDGSTWTDIEKNTPITINSGSCIYLAQKDGGVVSSGGQTRLKIDGGTVYLGGSIMSLLSHDTIVTDVGDYAFEYLFTSSTAKMYVETTFLPATKIRRGGYHGMFAGCTNLIMAPSLPAIDIYEECYQDMFTDCTNLVVPPFSLPCTGLPEKCYKSMFAQCKSLVMAPTMPADISSFGTSSCESMFSGCSKLKVSATKTAGSVQFFKTPSDEEPSTYASNMFLNTASEISTPAKETIYYYTI